MVRSFLEGDALEPKALEAKIGQQTGLLVSFNIAAACANSMLSLSFAKPDEVFSLAGSDLLFLSIPDDPSTGLVKQPCGP